MIPRGFGSGPGRVVPYFERGNWPGWNKALATSGMLSPPQPHCAGRQRCHPPRRFGALARGGQVVIVGGPKQLSPTSFIQRVSIIMRLLWIVPALIVIAERASSMIAISPLMHLLPFSTLDERGKTHPATHSLPRA